MSAVTIEQLQEALKNLVAQMNKANAAQQLLTLESAEVLLEAIQHIGIESLAVLALLMDKGIITAAELDAKKEEMAAQWQVESALDPHLAELTAAAEKLRQEIEQLRATLKEDAGA